MPYYALWLCLITICMDKGPADADSRDSSRQKPLHNLHPIRRSITADINGLAGTMCRVPGTPFRQVPRSGAVGTIQHKRNTSPFPRFI